MKSLLSEELAAAVENLVMVPTVPENNRDSSDSDAIHDYAEIYTPDREGVNWNQQPEQGPRPPTPPLHRFPSWEAKIYQVADGGLGIGPPTNTNTDDSSAPSTATNTNSSKHSNSSNKLTQSLQAYCDISVPVYATVKGRASQIRSMPFGDSSDDSSDGEDHQNQHSETNTRITNSSSDNTDTSMGTASSPSKSVKTTSSLSPAKRSSSGSPSKTHSAKRGKNIILY